MSRLKMISTKDIIAMYILVAQMLLLVTLWISEIFSKEYFQLHLSVLFVGVIAGVLLSHSQYGVKREKTKKDIFNILFVSIVSTICIYLVFFPIMSVLTHSTTTAVILIAGIISPITIPKIKNGLNKLKSA